MFNEDYQAPKKVQLPTVFQYLKTLKKNSKEIQQLFQVEIVWLPNKFNNVTLQTHKFRLILNETHPLYQHLVVAFDDIEAFGESKSFGIRVLSQETGDFKLEEMAKRGQWSQLSTTAYRWSTD